MISSLPAIAASLAMAIAADGYWQTLLAGVMLGFTAIVVAIDVTAVVDAWLIKRKRAEFKQCSVCHIESRSSFPQCRRPDCPHPLEGVIHDGGEWRGRPDV